MKLLGVSLGEGNTKVGDVFTFSLPSKETCPGASDWCRGHCYAHRYELRRPGCTRAYQSNLLLANAPSAFARRMIGILPRILPCFRIHVSGDFHSAAYIQAWVRICKAFPQTRFWSYTRSWAAPELLAPLEELRALRNVTLFGSTDPDMPLPPNGWRVAYLACDPRARGLLCRSQQGEEQSCLACGYCFRRKHGNVIFKVH